MTATGQDVSVVIVSWNVSGLLMRSIESLLAHARGLALEVFVVDNASTDGTVARVSQAFPDVRVIANAENVGFARANNQAIRQARGRYVLLVNPDTEWLDDSLSRLVAFLDRHPEVGVAGPKLLNADGQTIQFEGARRLPRPFDTFCEYVRLPALLPGRSWACRHLMPEWDHQDSRQVDCLSGACLLIRREVLDEVGLLDEGFPFNIEDIDWCHSVRRSRWQLYYMAEARLLHVGRQSILQNRGASTLNAMRGVYRYYRKQHGGAVTLQAWALLWPVSVAKLLGSLAVIILSPSRRSEAREQFSTFWKVCRLHPWST